MSIMLEVRALQKMVDDHPDKTRLEISIMLSMSTSWLYARLRLQRLLPDLQLALDHGRLPLTSALELSKLSPERQAALAERALILNTTDITSLVEVELNIIRQKKQKSSFQRSAAKGFRRK